MNAELRVWVPDDRWRIAGSGSERKCRRQDGKVFCRVPAVAALKRGKVWYYYCADHLYGRKLIDGVVWLSVHPDSPMARNYAKQQEASND